MERRVLPYNPRARANWILIIGIVFLIAVNIFVEMAETSLFWGSDKTIDQLFSLSETSKEILGHLREPVEVYHYKKSSSEDEIITRLLREFSANSENIIVTEADDTLVNNLSNQLLASGEEFKTGGILVTNEGKDRYRLLNTEDMFSYGEEYTSTMSGAEEKILGAVRYIDTGLTMHVYFLSGHREIPPKSMARLTRILGNKAYQVSTLSLANSINALNPETDVLMAISPKYDLSQAEYEEIREFMDKGGRMVICMDRFSFDTKGLSVNDNPLTYFEQIMGRYNLEVERDIVVGGDPAYIGLRATALSLNAQKHEITESIIRDSLPTVFTDASSVRMTGQFVGVTTDPLLRTSETSYIKRLDESFLSLKRRSEDAGGSFIMGAVSTKGDSELVVFGSSSFLKDENLNVSGNLSLVTGMMDNLSLVETGLNIPEKPMMLSSGGAQKGTISVLNAISFLILPAMVISVGIILYIRRKNL